MQAPVVSQQPVQESAAQDPVAGPLLLPPLVPPFPPLDDELVTPVAPPPASTSKPVPPLAQATRVTIANRRPHFAEGTLPMMHLVCRRLTRRMFRLEGADQYRHGV